MIQNFLIRHLLKPMAGLKNKIPEKVWQIVITLSIFAMQLCQVASAMGIITRYIIATGVLCVFFGIIIFAGLSADMKPLKLRPILWICWFGMGILMAATGVLVEPNVLATAAIWLVAMPVFFVVWGNRKLEELVKPFVNGIYLAFAVTFLICAINYPVSGGAYTGYYENQNGLALHCAGIYVIALVDLFSQERFNWRNCVAAVVAGFSAAMLFYTNARGGQLAAVICTVAMLIFTAVTKRKKIVKSVIGQVLPLVLAIAIAIPSCVSVFAFGFNLKNGHILQADKPSVGEVTVPPTEAPTTPPTEAPTTPPTEAPTAPPVGDALQDILDRQEERVNTGGDLDTITSGRVSLWKAYAKELQFLGHREDHQVLGANGKPIKMSSHLTLLQISYEYGALTGVFYLIFNLFAGVLSLIFAIKNKMKGYSAFPVMIAIGYAVVYMVEWVFSPISGVMSFAYIIMQVPFMWKNHSMCIAEKTDRS